MKVVSSIFRALDLDHQILEHTPVIHTRRRPCLPTPASRQSRGQECCARARSEVGYDTLAIHARPCMPTGCPHVMLIDNHRIKSRHTPIFIFPHE